MVDGRPSLTIGEAKRTCIWSRVPLSRCDSLLGSFFVLHKCLTVNKKFVDSCDGKRTLLGLSVIQLVVQTDFIFTCNFLSSTISTLNLRSHLMQTVDFLVSQVRATRCLEISASAAMDEGGSVVRYHPERSES